MNYVAMLVCIFVKPTIYITMDMTHLSRPQRIILFVQEIEKHTRFVPMWSIR
ncbi:MAG: hypothetical protein G01um101470_957 [Parcubacteria group bacterium Gr01-1014_70]|nr:MAG: hypothetical protein G01um101470_957 [Parcubacteria group bacterium Gr01-1014_70]